MRERGGGERQRERDVKTECLIRKRGEEREWKIWKRISREKERETDRQTDRQTERQTERQIIRYST